MKEEAHQFFQKQHSNCKRYLKEEETGFIYRQHVQGDEVNIVTTHNYLILVCKGKTTIDYLPYKNLEINGGEMVLVPQSSEVRFRFQEPTRLLAALFYIPTGKCEKMNYLSLAPKAITDYRLDTFPIRPALELFCRLQEEYLSMKAYCRDIQ